MPSVLGILFLGATVGAIAYRRELLPWVLSAAVPFTATAGLTVAGQSIVMYPVTAIILIAVAVSVHGARGVLVADLRGKKGLVPLALFTLWTLVVTMTAPVIFAGTDVLDPRTGIDDAIQDPSSLTLQISNFAQCIYLTIGFATVAALATAYRVSPRLPAAGFAVGTVLSSARSLLPEGLQKTLIDNSANVSYTAGTFDGVERMRGVFSEPSALGAFSVAAAVFFLMVAAKEQGWRRYAYLGMGGWSIANLILSVSGGALLSGLVVAVIASVRFAIAYVSGRQRLSPAGVVGVFLLAPAALILGPQIVAFMSLVLGGKADSTSFENRNAADAFSYALARDTYGIGVGIGSNRPSSFAASLLSTTGVIGVVLFTVAVAAILFRALSHDQYQPAAWALVSILISKVVSGPDVSDPPMWFLLAVCASSVWNARAAPPPPAGSPDDDTGVVVGRPASTRQTAVATVGGPVPAR